MLEEQLLESWHIHVRINLFMLEAIDPAAFAQPAPKKGRSFAQILAHIHNVRLMWLQAATSWLYFFVCAPAAAASCAQPRDRPFRLCFELHPQRPAMPEHTPSVSGSNCRRFPAPPQPPVIRSSWVAIG